MGKQLATAAKAHPPQAEDEDLLTIPEVADMARMTVDTFRYVYYQGNGPEGFRLGKRVVFRRRKVRDWIAGHEASTRREPHPAA